MKLTCLMVLRNLLLGAAFVGILTAASGCESKKAELGTKENPVKLYFVPSVDAKIIETSGQQFKEWLEKNTPYKYEIGIPQSYIAVVEAFGSKRADVASINTFGYIEAYEKYGVEARLTVLRHGLATYQSQFITKSDSPIQSIKDLNGKDIAFVDPSSASGYLLPLKMLKDNNVVVDQEIFAMSHDSVISRIYQGQVDAGATFYSPPYKGEIQDARRLVKTQYPDVEKKIKIIGLSEPILNDPIVFRKAMPEEMKKVIAEAFVKYISTTEGKDVFKKTYGVTDLQPATDKDYEAVRATFKSLKKSAEEMVKM